jgi:hypothetical protein
LNSAILQMRARRHTRTHTHKHTRTPAAVNFHNAQYDGQSALLVAIGESCEGFPKAVEEEDSAPVARDKRDDVFVSERITQLVEQMSSRAMLQVCEALVVAVKKEQEKGRARGVCV